MVWHGLTGVPKGFLRIPCLSWLFSALGCQRSPSRISVDALRVFSFGNLSKLSHYKCHFFVWKHLSNVAMFRTLSHEAVFILATGFWNLRQLLETQKLLLWATDDKNASKHERWNQLFHFMSFPCNVKCLCGSSKVMETRKFGNSQAFFLGRKLSTSENPSTLDSSILSCRSAGVTMRK